PHRALVNHATDMTARYELRGDDRVLQLASLSFDVAAEEIFPTWIAGGTVVLWPDRLAPSIPELVRFVEGQRLTVLNLPTPLWHVWVEELDHGASGVPAGLRRVVVGTSRVEAEKLTRWQALAPERVRWCNAYGCTEAAITSTVHEPGGAAPAGRGGVPIGRPIGNVRAYVADGRLEPVPAGSPGELVLAGEGLAQGYLHRPELTALRFVPEFVAAEGTAAGGRAYRTGDRVRQSADGALEILGRLDDQVKIRGFRVEPGEVAAVLARHPGVREAAVIAREIAGETRLVAYVAADEEADEAALRQLLRERLPEHLVPAAVVRLPRLPLTAHGKIDRAALPAPRLAGTAASGGAPH